MLGVGVPDYGRVPRLRKIGESPPLPINCRVKCHPECPNRKTTAGDFCPVVIQGGGVVTVAELGIIPDRNKAVVTIPAHAGRISPLGRGERDSSNRMVCSLHVAGPPRDDTNPRVVPSLAGILEGVGVRHPRQSTDEDQGHKNHSAVHKTSCEKMAFMPTGLVSSTHPPDLSWTSLGKPGRRTFAVGSFFYFSVADCR